MEVELVGGPRDGDVVSVLWADCPSASAPVEGDHVLVLSDGDELFRYAVDGRTVDWCDDRASALYIETLPW
jgi:hypothetical protein